MTNKMLFIGLAFLIVMGGAIFLVLRWRGQLGSRQDAEKRATIAFEEMNRLTKQLRDQGKAAATGEQEAIPPGQRLQQMYPGTKRVDGGKAGRSTA